MVRRQKREERRNGEGWRGLNFILGERRFHHREHPDCLHHRLVRQLLILRPKGTTEGSEYGPVHQPGAKLPAVQDLYTRPVSKEGTKNGQRLQSP